jgi:hypothetical protein
VLALTPAAWSVSETANATLNTTLPQAGPRGGLAAFTFGARESSAPQLAAFLRSHHDGERWDLVVTSAMGGSNLIADDGLSVMALGGFLGQDPATTPAKVARMVQRGEVRYFEAGGTFGRFGGGFGGIGPPPGGPAPNPQLAPRFRRQFGAPPGGGFGGPPRGGFAFGRGTANRIMSIVREVCTPVDGVGTGGLYDCRGKGAAMAASA